MVDVNTSSTPEASSAGPGGPVWTEIVSLQTVDRQGGLREVSISIGQPADARILLTDSGSAIDITGADYRDCLTQARRLLEADGRLLCCQGARPDVHASGMLGQVTNGRRAYELTGPKDETGRPPVVDIFAPAPVGAVTTVEDQRQQILHRLGLNPR
jgi:hypothetical protein